MKLSTTKPPTKASRVALRHVHKDLLTRISSIQHSADREFAGSFPLLVAAVEAGLRHEEAILEAEAAPHLHERRAENAMILCALHRVAVRVEQGCTELGRQVAAALQDMLALHRLARARLLAFSKRKRHLGHLH